MTNEISIGPNNLQPLSADKANGEFLSMHQAAKMTGYHQDYLGQLARSGKLDAHKVGRNWFTTKYAIDKMLGRIKEEIVVQQSVEPEFKPEPVMEPVMAAPTVKVEPEIKTGNIRIEKVYATVTEEEVEPVPAPQPVRVSVQLKKIKINFLNIANDAGPNLQEVLSTPVQEENISLRIDNPQTKETFLRWNKIAGNHKILSSAIVRQREFTEVVEKKIKNSSRQLWMYLSSATAVVVLAAFGINYFLSQQGAEENNSQQFAETEQQEKKVAGEATYQPAPLTGAGKIVAGEKSVGILDGGVKPDSRIEVKLSTTYNGSYEITQQSGGSFTLTFTPPPSQTVLFEYEIFNDNLDDTQ